MSKLSPETISLKSFIDEYGDYINTNKKISGHVANRGKDYSNFEMPNNFAPFVQNGPAFLIFGSIRELKITQSCDTKFKRDDLVIPEHNRSRMISELNRILENPSIINIKIMKFSEPAKKYESYIIDPNPINTLSNNTALIIIIDKMQAKHITFGKPCSVATTTTSIVDTVAKVVSDAIGTTTGTGSVVPEAIEPSTGTGSVGSSKTYGSIRTGCLVGQILDLDKKNISKSDLDYLASQCMGLGLTSPSNPITTVEKTVEKTVENFEPESYSCDTYFNPLTIVIILALLITLYMYFKSS